MRETILGNHLQKIPSIAVGCMRLSEKSKEEMNHFIHSALEQGAYFFDHADIYGGGMSETVFGEAFAGDPSLKREDIYLQSKCGIRQGCYDLSKEHILKSVDGILKRLQTDYLDLLLLHRPDALVEPEEVAAAFDVLFESGKCSPFWCFKPQTDADCTTAEVCLPTARCQPGSIQHSGFQSCCKWHGSQYGNPRFN